MKKIRTFIPILVAVTLFMLSQYIIVRQIWKQKDEVFNLRYRTVALQIMDELMLKKGESGFDRAYLVTDYLMAKSYIEKADLLFGGIDSTKYREQVLKNATKILSDEEKLSDQLSKGFEKLGFESGFRKNIYITYFDLLDFNQAYHITKVSKEEMKEKVGQSEIFVHSFISEGNNYKMVFDYYIDVTNKEKIIFREIAATLLLSFFSLLILSILFIATLRNYLEEKRMSNLKTDFINNMTHELKTPLSTITVAGKTLKHSRVLDDKPKIVETANLIGKQSVHLNRLINLILEISMWERSQFQIDPSETDVEEVLNDIADGFRNGCGKECKFKTELSINGARAKLDVVYFTTMINNLLNNAVKYSDGNPEVTLSARLSNDITISVSDNGIGISRTDQKHIFEKFYRVMTGNIHKSKGLGLGLYYVKRIAEAHGGTVSISSKPEKGSVFTINIPKL